MHIGKQLAWAPLTISGVTTSFDHAHFSVLVINENSIFLTSIHYRDDRYQNRGIMTRETRSNHQKYTHMTVNRFNCIFISENALV